MKKLTICLKGLILILFLFLINSCSNDANTMKPTQKQKVLFLHHSTGYVIWKGNPNKYVYKFSKEGSTLSWIKKLSKKENIDVEIEERFFPKKEPYGWNNYPYDYYNIWVKNGGEEPYKDEPTLEILSKIYDLIIFKHCFPVSNIQNDTTADINSDIKALGNYKLQYEALKTKMHEFPDTKFLIWTPAVKLEKLLTPEEAERTYAFYKWINESWDEPNDNIFLWDFYALETEGEKYLKPEYANNADDSHPSKEFGHRVSQFFANRIMQVILNKADSKDKRGTD